MEKERYAGACVNCDHRTDPDYYGNCYCKNEESPLSDGRWLSYDNGCRFTTDCDYK